MKTVKEKENIIQVTPENFKTEVLECDKPVLVIFYAAWDQPCRMQQTELDAIAEKHPDIKVCRIDVVEYPAFAGQYGIMMIPTTIAFKDGKKCKRATGLRRADVLLSMVR